MCGRFTLTASLEEIAAHFRFLAGGLEWRPRYNIAPSQQVLAIVRSPEGHRKGGYLRWGLIPPWAKDPSIGSRMINARSESVWSKPAFRRAIAKRRCLIPADGFYEWPRHTSVKRPVYIQLQPPRLFAMAGLWERWRSQDGEEIVSCTILTTSANRMLAHYHERMPVILAPEDEDLWLDPLATAEELQSLMHPYPEDEMTTRFVSTRVNSPKNDDADCLQPSEG